MRQINLTDVEQLAALFAQPAFTVHAKDLIAVSAEAVIREVTIMDTHKRDDPQAWAQRCLIFGLTVC